MLPMPIPINNTRNNYHDETTPYIPFLPYWDCLFRIRICIISQRTIAGRMSSEQNKNQKGYEKKQCGHYL